MAQLYEFSHRGDIENEVRDVLRKNGATDLSKEACKQWVRDFIADLVPEWPERTLTETDRRLIGHEFQRLSKQGTMMRAGARVVLK